MATHVYKCPNCSAGLSFDPARGDFACEYCLSRFDAAQLEALETAQQAEAKQEADAAAQAADGDADEAALRLYNCPNCGAEVVSDATTAATFCFYCHSPVILTGQLAGKFKPDSLIPFRVGKAEVEEKLLAWCRKKRFIDRRFFDESQMGKLSGVYFPFWVLASRFKSHFTARATKLRVWIVGNIEYTETEIHQIDRQADFSFRNLSLKALSREDAQILSGLYPYDMEEARDFDMAYLSGFQAEKRDMERADVEEAARATLRTAAERLHRGELAAYGSLSGENCAIAQAQEDWKYTLLPAWTLTYQYGGETYYFAMNGQNGKVAGRVPVDKRKLALCSALCGAGAFLLVMLVRMLLC